MINTKESIKNILVVLGTRPEAIKLAPIILNLRRRNDLNVLVCNTEQQKELSNQTLSFFGLQADINLDVMKPNQTLAGVQSIILNKLSEVFTKYKIDAVLVQGDTMSVLCGALIGYYNKVPVFHVEAGLRSYDLFEPFPEEALRQITTRLATLHFAPTQANVEALINEKIAPEKIVLTGNTVVDALKCLSDEMLRKSLQELIRGGEGTNDKLVLVTVHRRENHGGRLNHILQAIKILSNKFPDHYFILPVHPNPNVRTKVYESLSGEKNIILTDPLAYPQLVSIMREAKLILTDSGGIQEEAPTFGVPLLVMRYETERSEGVTAGFAQLVGADTDKIVKSASVILSQDKMKTRLDSSKNPYGDGTAAEKIANVIRNFWGERK